jgi:hypothetical protein
VPTSPDAQRIRVVAKISAENPTVDNISFLEPEAIIELIKQTKESAKTHFFFLATEETHRLMGAQYATE